MRAKSLPLDLYDTVIYDHSRSYKYPVPSPKGVSGAKVQKLRTGKGDKRDIKEFDDGFMI